MSARLILIQCLLIPMPGLSCLGQSVAQSSYKITYLFHSGWLVETKNETILIDYIPSEDLNLDSVLFKKFTKAIAEGKNSFILITHDHYDHFHKPLLNWNKKLKGITTILGWDYHISNNNSVIKLNGRDSTKVNNVKITSHPSTDAGSGFLISTKNLTFYHAGDHAAWDTDALTAYSKEVDFVRSLARNIDIAFFPIARGKLGGCKVTESITNGTILAIKNLQPRFVFPMHLQCNDLKPYRQFAENMKVKFPKVTFRFPTTNHQEFALD